MFHLKQAQLLFLGVGLLALLATLVLYVLISRVRRRYREGKAALEQMRSQAQGAHLTMEGTVGAVPDKKRGV